MFRGRNVWVQLSVRLLHTRTVSRLLANGNINFKLRGIVLSFRINVTASSFVSKNIITFQDADRCIIKICYYRIISNRYCAYKSDTVHRYVYLVNGTFRVFYPTQIRVTVRKLQLQKITSYLFARIFYVTKYVALHYCFLIITIQY